MLRGQSTGKPGIERMAAAGRARVHRRPDCAWRTAALLRGDVGGVLQDVVDGYQPGARPDSLCALRPRSHLRIPTVGHLSTASIVSHGPGRGCACGCGLQFTRTVGPRLGFVVDDMADETFTRLLKCCFVAGALSLVFALASGAREG